VALLRRRKDTSREPRRRIRKLRLFLLVLVLGTLGFGAFLLGAVQAISEEIPGLDPAACQQRLSKNGWVKTATARRTLAVLRGQESRVIVPSNDISPLMKQAIVAIEDQRFFEHRAVDVHGILRAVWADVTNQAVVQGGSTITQQFIKNTCTSSAPSITRKLKEAALAWQLEQRWSKERILTAYLNTIYFGNGAYGVQEAAQVYFHESAKDLNLPQAALLAGIPENPSLYDPVSNKAAARHRRNVVLEKMFQLRDIDAKELRWSLRAGMPDPARVQLPGTQGPVEAQYFVNYVRQQLTDRCGSSQVLGGGLHVRTTLNLGLQQIARKSIAQWLHDPTGPSAALVAVDPRNGRVLAMVGGRNFKKSQFNLAVQGERQPGSSFKPFVLTTALDRGISPDTQFMSHPVAIQAGDRVWVVHNFANSYLGRIPLSEATQYSDNSVYAQLTDLVGPGAIARTAHRLGITSPLRPYFSIGLGAQAVNPLEMARAYSVFANGGYRIDGSIVGDHPRAVLSVENGSHGCDGENKVVRRRVISPETDAVVNALLQRVVQAGTGVRAQLPDGRPVAGKTGTTENYGDAWFVGYTPQLVTAVWVGYPNKLVSMSTQFHGQPVEGGTYPALVWRSFMTRALNYLHDQPESFPPEPSTYGNAEAVVDRFGQLRVDNGNCRNVMSIVYLPWAHIPKTANCKPNEVEVPDVVGENVLRAKEQLGLQPLKAQIVYRPAAPLQRTGVVVDQIPRKGTLSSYQKVTLVLAKPLHGVVPGVVGSPLPEAQQQLRRMKLASKVVKTKPGGRAGRVVFQAPRGGVAAAPGMLVRLVVSRGGGARAAASR
jgi:penicillin-binding protein 1A